MGDNFAKRHQIVRQASFAPSGKAATMNSSTLDEEFGGDSYLPSRGYSGDDSITKVSRIDTSVKQVNRRHSPPDTPQSTRLSAWLSIGETPYSYSVPPSFLDDFQSPFYPDDKRPPTPRYYLPANPAPGHQFQKFDKRRVDQIPQHKGWDEFHSPRGSLDVQRDVSAASAYTPWPTADRQIPQLPPLSNLREELGKKNASTYIQTSSAQRRRLLTPATYKGKKPRSQANQETVNTMCKTAEKIKNIYTQGPKGEGQKLWNAIRGIRDEKHELKSIQTPFGAWSPHTNARNKKAQEEQLNANHTIALGFAAPKPVISSPLPMPTMSSTVPSSIPKISSALQSHPVPSIPVRPELQPELLSAQRSPVILSKPLLDTTLRQPPGTPNVPFTSFISSYVPVTTSRNVQYDAEVNNFEFLQTRDHIPSFNAVPKPKSPQKKGLSPRPIPAPGEKEPPELAEQEKMYKSRVGTTMVQLHSASFVPLSRAPVVKEQNIPGTMFSNPHLTMKSQTSLAAAPTLANRAHAKHQQKLKQPTSRPQTIDFASSSSSFAEAGGAAAVVAVVQPIPNKSAKRGSIVVPADKGAKRKDKKPNWAGAVYGKYTSRHRRDSDASFTCVDAHHTTEQYRQAQQQSEQQQSAQPQQQDREVQNKPKHQRSSTTATFPRLPGPGPREAALSPSPLDSDSGNAGCQGPGAVPQSGHSKRYSDETLVPSGWEIRKSEANKRETRETGCYRQVDSVFGEYSRGSGGRNGWIWLTRGFGFIETVCDKEDL